MTTVRYSLLLAAVFIAGAGAGAGSVFYHFTWGDPPRRCEATVYLPLVDNEDHRFSDETLQQAVGLFVKEFGGATLGAEQEGYWQDSHGRVRREPVRLLVVSFERGRLPDLRRVLHEVGRLLGQEAMYARLDEPRILLLPVEGKSSSKDP